VQRVFFHRVNVATAGVLAAHGFEVHSPEAPSCCGALELHAGEEAAALERLRRAIEALEPYDAVAVNAAGCGSALKEAGHLLRDDPVWADRAATFSSKVRDVTELLAEVDPAERRWRHPITLRVAYHDACHLAHAQGIRTQPRDLLRSIPGLEVLEPVEWEICCGSAGVYNVLQPDAGAELGRRKAANLIATGADAVAAGNPGCALQIATHAEEAGVRIPLYHPVELLWMSVRGVRSRPAAGPDRLPAGDGGRDVGPRHAIAPRRGPGPARH
jgi:glycolate oxidase iron-sulfur subunit